MEDVHSSSSLAEAGTSGDEPIFLHRMAKAGGSFIITELQILHLLHHLIREKASVEKLPYRCKLRMRRF